ncbi:glycosyltransferase family 4 protein [Galbibacter sp. EGI 63066]|uniref:glycosyltransferase family 4 protein n=1 Tax=Galbibacter sp. EGI 63066 TaxID=2993559 RepID=UPI00224951B0|nr:glycosyltransferase family 4 protein [Galbibacter sp. EGI 63066]MCX2682017.1 glycosyltransferase family 4 protein [Galbibacter sp. EGI 63066]
MYNSKKILIIGYVWPEPTSSAAGSRMLQLIDFFKENRAEITFASPAKQSEHIFNLASIGIDAKEIQLNDTSFDAFVADLKPDIVIFDRYMIEEQFGWRVAEQYPEAIRILDTEDLHFLRKVRQIALKKDVEVNMDMLLQSDLAKREIASMYRCDLSLIISEEELELLKGVFKINADLLLYLPFLLPKTEQNQKQWEERADFIFIGNFVHAPNWDAVLQLKKTIWLGIRKALPKAKLHIYGAYPSQKVFDLHKETEGFMVHGRAEDAMEVMSKARVCLAPMRFGAGLKGKLIEAMQSGTPSVTTVIGAEGINGDYEWNGIICDDIAEVAKTAIELYSDQQLWEQAQDAGYEILEKRFDAKAHKARFKTTLEKLETNIQQHRTANFTGAMLQQQTTQASKYMAKWIEEKNK